MIKKHQIRDKRDQLLFKSDQNRSKTNTFCLTHLTISVAHLPWRYRQGRFDRRQGPKNGQNRTSKVVSDDFVRSLTYESLGEMLRHPAPQFTGAL